MILHRSNAMSSLLTDSPEIATVADLLDRLGGVPPERVRLVPTPGSATEADVVEIEARENRLCELVDGVLVEKAMGFRESMIAVAIAAALRAFVVPRKLGVVVGADGMMRLWPGLVRLPDVAFVSRGRLPGGVVPKAPIAPVAPDLAVEVLSPGNTAAEMKRKHREYFKAGVQLVWQIDLESRTADVYSAPKQFVTIPRDGALDGGHVLPGFTLALEPLFAELD
jgi:Uma2 family endonuclease